MTLGARSLKSELVKLSSSELCLRRQRTSLNFWPVSFDWSRKTGGLSLTIKTDVAQKVRRLRMLMRFYCSVWTHDMKHLKDKVICFEADRMAFNSQVEKEVTLILRGLLLSVRQFVDEHEARLWPSIDEHSPSAIVVLPILEIRWNDITSDCFDRNDFLFEATRVSPFNDIPLLPWFNTTNCDAWTLPISDVTWSASSFRSRRFRNSAKSFE